MSKEHFQKLERMYLGAPINRYFAPRIEISEGQAIVTLPVRDDFHHAAFAVHGAVYFKVLDDAAFFAVNSVVDDVFVQCPRAFAVAQIVAHPGKEAHCEQRVVLILEFAESPEGLLEQSLRGREIALLSVHVPQ